MEVEERPTKTYRNISRLSKHIGELGETVVMPLEEAELFKRI